MAKKYGEPEYKALYEAGKQVYDGKISRERVADELMNNYRMSNGERMTRNTVKMYIQFLTDLLTPKVIKRTMGVKNVRYYANRVLEDYGQEALRTFLQGLEYHIDYRQDNDVGVPGFCRLHNELSREIGLTPKF